MAEQTLEYLYKGKPNAYFEWKRPEIRKFVPTGAKRILDVGCGAAGFSGSLRNDLGVEAWGVELNESAADLARPRLDKVIHGRFERELNLPENHFDVVFFNDVLEHVPDPGMMLVYAKTLLVPDGRIVASLPNFRYFPNIWKIVVEKSARYEPEGIMDRTHLRIFTKSSIELLFKEAELEIELIEGINPIQASKKFTILNAITLNWLADTRYLQFAVVAKT